MSHCGCKDKISVQEDKCHHDITYTVKGNDLIVKKGKCKEVIPIYEECPFRLTKQFQILNLYLNRPLTGIVQQNKVRELEPETNYTTKYKSSGKPENCDFMTFETLSPEDEAHRSSRVVSPRNELIQLYQINFTYKVEYEICNTSKCGGARVNFLYADFSNDPSTEGAYYPLSDTKGNNVSIKVCDHKRGHFYVNGWQYPLLVQVKGDANINLTITGIPKEEYPPYPFLILPVETKFGFVDVIVYEVLFDGVNFNRHVTDFRGVNAIVRGEHQIIPYFPCFGTTGVVISPPPLHPEVFSKNNSLVNYGATPGDQINLVSKDSRTLEKAFDIVSFRFSVNDMVPSNSFIKLSNGSASESLALNITLDFPSIINVTINSLKVTFVSPLEEGFLSDYHMAFVGNSNIVGQCNPQFPWAVADLLLSEDKMELSGIPITFTYLVNNNNRVQYIDIFPPFGVRKIPKVLSTDLDMTFTFLRTGKCIE